MAPAFLLNAETHRTNKRRQSLILDERRRVRVALAFLGLAVAFCQTHEPDDLEVAPMPTQAIRFRCPHCRSRIKAPAKLVGQRRDCPGCKLPFAVPRFMAEDAGPVLVPIEEHDHYTLAVVSRQRQGLLR
jgi:hypothetical protein